MLDWSTWKDIADFVAKLAVPLLGYGTMVLRDIRSEMRKLSEGLLVLETQHEAHQRQADERHETVRRELEALKQETFQNGRLRGSHA